MLDVYHHGCHGHGTRDECFCYASLFSFLSVFPPKNAAGKDKKMLRESFLEMFHSLKVLLDTVDVLFL